MSHLSDTSHGLPDLDGRITSVLRYWDELRGDRVAPGRVEISPAALTRHLSRISVLERPRAGTVRMRLAGATLSTRAGMELRGMPFRALFELDDRNRAMDAAENAIATPVVSILALARVERKGPVPEALMAILPLADTRGALTRGLAIYSERAAATPFVTDLRGRFAVTGSWSLDIPEVGPIIGPMGNTARGQLTATRVVRSGGAPQAVATQPEGDAVTRKRPVFQVIDGGLS
ncbi:PAS domain-containing protein [Gymnodinialimonas ceratoperidinii]|uniref:PAS domain-containing protein n=1 Tax=Gymnodinialimonas ceratoperidinii TaxID=2856823 RepID=A0A8F6TVI6_9RHOB|nr:PAS domain-containing protein [Gymnodinialimonas ceratoperidinii]QXT38461.1 PAS domain-containing protein [Gymnodinialimonas ceratoperidinii]